VADGTALAVALRGLVHGSRSCGAELLFQVFTEREERAFIAIASNAAFIE